MLVMANESFDLHGPPQLDPQAPTPEPVGGGGLKRVDSIKYDPDMIEHNPRVKKFTRVTRGGLAQPGAGVRLIRILGNPLEKRQIRVASDKRIVDEYGRFRAAPGAVMGPYPAPPQQLMRNRVIAEPPRVETIDLTNEAPVDNDLVHEDEYRMVTGFAKRPVDPHVVPNIVQQTQPIRTPRFIRPVATSVRGVPMRTMGAVPRQMMPVHSNGGPGMGSRVMRQMMGRGGMVQRTGAIRRAPGNVARVAYQRPVEPLRRVRRVQNTVRVGFDANDEAERLSLAIAHEEELMRLDEEKERAKKANSLPLFHMEGNIRRVEEGLRQKELAARSELERQRLSLSNSRLSTYTSPFASDATHRHQQLIEQTHTTSKKPSNLAPSKDDCPDMRVAKQVLDSLITHICKSEKPEKVIMWQRAPPQPTRVRESNPRHPVARLNQQDAELNERMDFLKREVMKRRQKIEEQAERDTGITPPWKKSRARARARPKKKPAEQSQNVQSKKENVPVESDVKMVMDPSEISLGGDAVVYSSNNEAEETDEVHANLTDLLDEVRCGFERGELAILTAEHLSILDNGSMMETEEVLEEGRLDDDCSGLSFLSSPKKQPPIGRRKSSPEKAKRESISEKSEASATTVSTIPAQPPRGRGRPPKAGKKDGSKAAVASLAVDAAKCKCICKDAFDPRRTYIACTSCKLYYHPQCVGLGEKKSKKTRTFVCKQCKDLADADVYCLCRKPYDSNQFYVGCDGCEGWFHPPCVGTTQTEVEKLDSYMCPSCNGKTVPTLRKTGRLQ